MFHVWKNLGKCESIHFSSIYNFHLVFFSSVAPSYSPLTESLALVDAVPASKVTVQLSLRDNSFSRSRCRRPLSNVTISALGDSFTGFPSRSQRQFLLSGRDKAHSNSTSPPSKVSASSRPWTMVMGLAGANGTERKSGSEHWRKGSVFQRGTVFGSELWEAEETDWGRLGVVLFPCGGKLTFHMKRGDRTDPLCLTGVCAPVLSGHTAKVQASHIPVLLHYHPSAIGPQRLPVFLPLSFDRPRELADELSRLVFDHPKVLHIAHHFDYGIWGWGQGSQSQGWAIYHLMNEYLQTSTSCMCNYKASWFYRHRLV